MLLLISLVVAAVIVVFLISAALQPAAFRIERSAVIPALPAVVFPHVNDLHLWQEWSPWARMDPTCKTEFTGADKGTGAQMSWNGNNKVGEGKMTILQSRQFSLVQLQLEFFRPFKATNIAEFTLSVQDGGTLVNWAMTGRNSFIGKCMGLLINCDKMVGGQFEQGFANLSEVIQKTRKS